MTSWKPLCKECGSENLIVDAVLRWDIDEAKWMVYGESNFTKCLNEDCDKWEDDTLVDWIDVDAE